MALCAARLLRALDPFECEMAITIKQRAFAGLWFMVAAALLIVPIFNSTVASSQFLDFFIWLLLSPLLISGLVGSLLGASILDAQRARSWWRAALRGLSVAVISYLLYAIGLSAWEGYANHGGFSFSEAFTRMLWILVVFGAIFGWVVAIYGAFAGWMLHLMSASLEKRSDVR
jgi:hypothetical protein